MSKDKLNDKINRKRINAIYRLIAKVKKIMKTKCPACKTIGDHVYNGIQTGLPVRDSDNKLVKDSNGNYVTKSGELWTCKNCGSTWFKEIN